MSRKYRDNRIAGYNPGGVGVRNSRREESKPPDGFIDNTVLIGRYREDGTVEYTGSMPAFPDGWNDPAQFRKTPGYELKRKQEQEDEEMAKAKTEQTKEQTPSPEPVQAANQKPDQGCEESADASVAQGKHLDDMKIVWIEATLQQGGLDARTKLGYIRGLLVLMTPR